MSMVRVSSQFFIPTGTSGAGDNSGRPQIRYLVNGQFVDLALAGSSASTIEMTVDPSTFVVTASLKNSSGTVISSDTIDLPLESVVVNASYSDGVLTLTLQNGNTVEVDISDIVSGLVNDVKVNGVSVVNADGEAIITIPTALADLTDDSTHRLVTDAEKTGWNAKLSATGDGKDVTVTFSDASARANISTGEKLSVMFGKIKKFFTDLKTVAFTGSYNDLTNKPTIPAAQVNSDWNAVSGIAQILNKPTIPSVNDATLTIKRNGTQVQTFTANQGTDATADISVPTALSDLSDDTTHRLVTDTEKGTWGKAQYLAICDTAAGTVAKVVTVPNFTLTTGTTIAVYFLNKNTVASPTLNVNSTGAKSIYMNNAAATASNLPGGWVLLYYDGSRYQTGNTSNWLQASYSAGANQIRQHCDIIAGAAITANRLIYAKNDNKYYVLAAGATINTTMPILYANSAIASGATGSNNWLIRHQDAKYMFGNGDAVTVTNYAPIFIVGKLSGTTFTVDSTNWYTQTIPSTENSKHYMLIGISYSTTAIRLLPDHPIYEYNAGAFKSINVDTANDQKVYGTKSFYSLGDLSVANGTKSYIYTLPPETLEQASESGYLPVCKGCRLWNGNITAGGNVVFANNYNVNYNLFRVVIGTVNSIYNTEILATRRGSTATTFKGGAEAATIRGIGGYRGSVNGALQLFDVALTVTSSLQWKLVTCENTNIAADGTITHSSGLYIKSIIGVA